MDQKIKKYFSIFNRLNKKWLFLALLFFVVLGLFFVFQPALAQIADIKCPPWTDLGYIPCIAANFILSILIKIVVLLVFALPLLISAFVVGIVALILGWIISPDFISLKFTQNPFVDIGLSITKSFANMGFILFLVVIALATILRIEEYKAKKTLPTLILIALLINFSPVLCGAIIDFTNIVMDFFLSNISGINGFVNFVMSAANSIWNSLWNSGLDLWANIAAAMQVIIGIAFNWFAAFIFILFCALFIMRYIMLWILVILSPIAFVSYILPITKGGQSLLNWRKWWEQLISWSIIGIIAGFFLYLGFTMISLINNNSSAFVTQPAIGQLGLMNNILPYLIPLVLLWVAYRETKRTSAMFAKEIVEVPEKLAKQVTQAVVSAGMAVATGGAGAIATKMVPEGVRKWGERQMVAPTWGTDVPGIKGALMRTVGAPFGYTRRKIGETVSYIPSLEKEDVKKAESDAAKRDATGNLNALREAKSHSEMLGTLKTMMQKKQIKDALDENIVGKGGVLGDEEVIKAYKKARQFRDKDAIEDIEISFAHLANRFAKIVDKETEKYTPAKRTGYVDPATGIAHSGLNQEDFTVKKYRTYQDKIMDAIKSADDVKKLPKGWQEDVELMASAHKLWTGSQIGKAAEHSGREFVEKFQEGVEDSMQAIRTAHPTYSDREVAEAYVRERPKIALYLSGNAAQDFGFKSPSGLTRKDVREILK